MKPQRGWRAFTLVECLITIALIAVVVGLILPSLGRARLSSQQLASLANLRGHAQTLHTYAGDFDDSFPFLADPQATYTVLRHGGATVSTTFFHVDAVWNYALAGDYYDDRHDHDSFRLPWNRLWSGASDYLLSDTLFTRPEYWEPRTRQAGTSQWRPVRLSEVLFPSAKGCFVEHPKLQPDGLEPGWIRQPLGREARAAFVDGSASSRNANELADPYPFGAGPSPPATFLYGLPVLHTLDGVRGRDLR